MGSFDFDAYAPAEIARRVEAVGVAKARLPLLPLLMLGLLAGAFIGLGTLYFVIVVSDGGIGFAAQRVLGGAVFSLGLLLVVVAGAELFTGNNLLAMAWADGKIGSGSSCAIGRSCAAPTSSAPRVWPYSSTCPAIRR